MNRSSSGAGRAHPLRVVGSPADGRDWPTEVGDLGPLVDVVPFDGSCFLVALGDFAGSIDSGVGGWVVPPTVVSRLTVLSTVDPALGRVEVHRENVLDATDTVGVDSADDDDSVVDADPSGNRETCGDGDATVREFSHGVVVVDRGSSASGGLLLGSSTLGGHALDTVLRQGRGVVGPGIHDHGLLRRAFLRVGVGCQLHAVLEVAGVASRTRVSRSRTFRRGAEDVEAAAGVGVVGDIVDRDGGETPAIRGQSRGCRAACPVTCCVRRVIRRPGVVPELVDDERTVRIPEVEMTRRPGRRILPHVDIPGGQGRTGCDPGGVLGGCRHDAEQSHEEHTNDAGDEPAQRQVLGAHRALLMLFGASPHGSEGWGSSHPRSRLVAEILSVG